MKKVILFFSLGITVASFSTVMASTVQDFANAVFLSDRAIITPQTESYQYRLDDKILRQEVIGMALKIKGIPLPENYKCKKYFVDTIKNDWVCRAVELAADNGIITRSNKYANPGKNITRAEALGIIRGSFPDLPYKSSALEFTENDFSSEYRAGWQKEIFQEGYGYGLFTFPAEFHPNYSATRAIVFSYAVKFLEISTGSEGMGNRTPIDWGYEKDSYNVYHDGIILPGVDPKTFQLYEADFFSDKSGVYKFFRDDKVVYKIPSFDKNTLTVLNVRYIKDAQKVYHCDGFRDYQKNTVDFKCVDLMADTATFVCKGQGTSECEDKTYFYSYEKKKKEDVYQALLVSLGFDIETQQYLATIPQETSPIQFVLNLSGRYNTATQKKIIESIESGSPDDIVNLEALQTEISSTKIPLRLRNIGNKTVIIIKAKVSNDSENWIEADFIHKNQNGYEIFTSKIYPYGFREKAEKILGYTLKNVDKTSIIFNKTLELYLSAFAGTPLYL